MPPGWAPETEATLLEAVRWVIVVTLAAFSSATMAGDVDQGRAALAAALKKCQGHVGERTEGG